MTNDELKNHVEFRFGFEWAESREHRAKGIAG